MRQHVHERAGNAQRIADGGAECVYPHLHMAWHAPHPDGGREVCYICHPPAAVIRRAGLVIGPKHVSDVPSDYLAPRVVAASEASS